MSSKHIPFWSNMGGIRKKIILNSLLITLIPFILISVYFYVSTYYRIVNDFSSRTQQGISMSEESINGKLTLYVERSRTIITSSNVVSGIWGYFESDMSKIADFRDIMKSLTIDLANWGTEIDAFKFYLSNYTGFEDTFVASTNGLEDPNLIMKVLSASVKDVYWSPQVKLDSRNKPFICFYRNVTDLIGREGILEVNIPYDKISPYIFNMKDLPENSIVTHENQQGTVLFAKGSKTEAGQSAGVEHNDSYFTIHGSKLADQSTLSVSIPKSVVTREYVKVLSYILLAFVLVVIFIIFASFRTSMNITRSLNRFISYIKNNDDLLMNNEMPEMEANDDISIIKTRFLLVIRKMKEMYSDLLEAKNQNNSLEVQLLQARFNPHLLYNTLSAIKWSTIRMNDTKMTETVDALTNYYRIVLNNGHSVIEVAGELNMIKQYISIVNYTHRNDYNLKIYVEENMMNRYILKHTLQPVVENAIVHGLKGKGPSGNVTILGRMQGDDIEFEVIDNGYGMVQEKMDQLVNLQYEAAYGGYGIKNLIQRIKFFCGETYGIAIQSESGCGTKVTIRLKAAGKPQ